jgi:hypothetical protein
VTKRKQDNEAHFQSDSGSIQRPSLGTRMFVGIIATVLALLLAEWGAGMVRNHAFPYLNIYVQDARYGVRLEANTTTATRSRQGRITLVQTNDLGFRGDQWTPAEQDAPVAGRILLLGDSQIFGYGVDQQQAVATQLEQALGEPWHTLNAAVPTWGPPEYTMAMEDLGSIYRPEIVVLVANTANDWFETKAPNTRRTTARDGWAAFNLAGTEEPTWFPGRRWLYGRSHLFYVLRRIATHRSGPPPAHAVSAQRLVDDLRFLLRKDGPYRSRLTRHALNVAEHCKRLGCRLVVAGLPLDVQVHPGEWAKYATAPLSGPAFERTRAPMAVLLDELRTHKIRTVDLAPALAAGSPGAFLPDDYHLAPQGHSIIAQVLAATLRKEGTVSLAHREIQHDMHREAQP